MSTRAGGVLGPSHNRIWQVEGDLRVNAFRYDEERSFPAHQHDVYSLIFCFNGIRETVQAGCRESQGAGEIMIVSPGTLHSSRYPSRGGPVEGLSLEVPCNLLRRVMSRQQRRLLNKHEFLVVNGKTRDMQAEQVARDLHALSANGFCPSRALNMSLRISELLVSKWPTNLLRSSGEPPSQQLPRHAFLTAVEYLTTCPRAELNWEALSRAVGMSYSRFRVLFKRSTNMSPGQFYGTILMERARQYLHSSPLSVTEIARQLGFANSSHFGYFFRANQGTSPLDFKRIPQSLLHTASAKPL